MPQKPSFVSIALAAIGFTLGIVLSVPFASAQTSCSNPTPTQGYALPCPVFSLSSASVSQSQSLTLNATPQPGTDYIYTNAYVYDGAWKPFTMSGNNAYPSYSSALATLTLSSTQLSSLSVGTHYAVVWDWLWDSTAQCYKGPGLNQCNTGQWRLQTFSITAGPTPIPSGSGGLLTGMTPSNFTLPSGWTLWQIENFDTTSPVCGHTGEECFGSGTASIPRGTSSSGNRGATWNTTLPSGNKEIYLSFWQLLATNGVFNDEQFITDVWSLGDPFSEVTLDWQQDNRAGTYVNGTLISGFNGTVGQLTWPSQCSGTDRTCEVERWGSNYDVGYDGQWHQWEVHYKANTPGLSDGTLEAWRDGVQVKNYQNANVVGIINVLNNPLKITAGGSYTKALWLKNCSDQGTCQTLMQSGGPFVCGTFIGDGYGASEEPYYNPSNTPCPPTVPDFSGYIDDVIVLYK